MKLTAKFSLKDLVDDGKDPVQAAKYAKSIALVRSHIADLEGAHKRLLKMAFAWWRSERSKVDLLLSAASVASTIARKRDRLSNLLFEHEVLTKGRMGAHADKAASAIAKDIECSVFAVGPLMGTFKGLVEALDMGEYKAAAIMPKVCCQESLTPPFNQHTVECWTNFRTHYVGDDCPGGHVPVEKKTADLVETSEGKTEKYPSKRGHRKTVTNCTRAELRVLYRPLNQEDFNAHLHAAQAADSKGHPHAGGVDKTLYSLYADLIPGDLRLHLAALEDVAVEKATNNTTNNTTNTPTKE